MSEPARPVPEQGASALEASPPTTKQAPQSPVPALPPAEIAGEVARLRAEFRREVPHHLAPTEASDRLWIERAKAALEGAGVRVDRPELLVVVDRNPEV